jgi:hypothetical protein
MSRQLLEKLAQSLATRLAPHGFERSRESFYRDQPGGEVLKIDLERHRQSDDNHLKVRVAASLTCEAIARFKGERKLSRRPKHGEFVAFLGEFLPRKIDAWWLVEEALDPEWNEKWLAGRGTVDEIADQIASVIVSEVLPAVAPLTSEVAIRDFVLAGGSFGGWGRIDPLDMAVLTAKHGPPEAFERYAERTLTKPDWPESYYRPLIERLRRGDFYAPGFAPGEKGEPKK